MKNKPFIANGNVVIAAVGQGFLNCTTSSGCTLNIPMKDVLYIPELDGGLLSLKQLTNDGLTVHFHKRK